MPRDGKDNKAYEKDLKAREYRDETGEIHHHTHPYMERHGKDGGRSRSASSSRSDGHVRSGGAQTTTDHKEIRTWAESHGGRPAAVRSTHRRGDAGIIRIMFPDAPNSDHDALTEITWSEFFDEFDKRDLALVYDDDSLFSKLIGRAAAEKREKGDDRAAR